MQPEPPDGDRLVEVISDKEPTVRQVPGQSTYGGDHIYRGVPGQ